MPKFLRFRTGQLTDTIMDQILTDGPLNLGRRNQIMLRNVKITIV